MFYKFCRKIRAATIFMRNKFRLPFCFAIWIKIKRKCGRDFFVRYGYACTLARVRRHKKHASKPSMACLTTASSAKFSLPFKCCINSRPGVPMKPFALPLNQVCLTSNGRYKIGANNLLPGWSSVSFFARSTDQSRLSSSRSYFLRSSSKESVRKSRTVALRLLFL